MRAIEATAFGDADTLELVETDAPEPGSGEVRIDVRAAGVNFADIMQRRGEYLGGPEPPFVPGNEVAGVIDAVGEGVDREPGESVVTIVNGGGYAEYTIADARGLIDIPEAMTFQQAAGFPLQWITAHNCLHEWGELEAGERVLIHACAGGVGTAAVQLASEAGAEVFGTASTAEKLETAAEFGVDHGIDYTETAFDERVDELTDGEGVDLVLDGVGGETTARSLDALREFGRIVVYGAASGEPGRPKTTDLLFANQRVIGYHLGRALGHDSGRVLGAIPELVQLLGDGTLEIRIGHTFDLTEAAEAHEFIEARRSSGKVVLLP